TSASAKQAIDAANAQWPRLTSSGHADSIAEFYAADAVIMPPNMATMRGKDAVRAFFATINTIDPHPTLTPRAVTVVASGPVAVETGRWHRAYDKIAPARSGPVGAGRLRAGPGSGAGLLSGAGRGPRPLGGALHAR